ncbi:zonadhesin isoform X2 [Mastacembelus armatus]|uniref:zonadhesin isoform X2 n=1 Tax=Mastacembelus armatus TaxID=205130 RepID=UPI000E45CBCE|nr:zonadhesin-like isoform X2 [Mastacembelus armatus]
MHRGICTDFLVTVTVFFLTQTECRAENDFSLVTLPQWGPNSEYVTKCLDDRHTNVICDWTRSPQTAVEVNMLESGPLGMKGEACLEFWYLSPAAANESELRALLKSSAGLVEIWTSPALPRNSWRQVFIPLNIIESGTQVVLEAVSIEEQVTFKQIGVRRGSCGPQCESNTELWTDESTRCLCSVGQLSCSPSQCPKGQICGPQRQGSTSGTCTIHSHTGCSTFDGVLFRFTAPCTAILAKTCSTTDALPMFSVEVVSEDTGNSSVPTVQQVTVYTENITVSLLKRQTQRVAVNGVWRKLPLNLWGGTVNIKSNPATVLLETSFGLTVSYDNTGVVHVSLPSSYSDKVCGLCGNFNYHREDDFHKSDGTNAQNATAQAESWQTGGTTFSCETILAPHQCDPLDEAKYASEPYCGSLLSGTGPFAGCQSVLAAESYFKSCMVSMCSTHGDPALLCETLQAYTDICLEAGVNVPTWRNSTFCSHQCGENSHYNSCADGCPEVCSHLDIAGSCGNCEGRCECDSGFKLSMGKCVLAGDCGCWYGGKHYEKGATFVEGECVKQCQCMGNDDVQCTTMQCKDNEVCKVKDGVKDCFPLKPATCSVYGDPHYITFDRMAYDFQGGCSYTLTTTCSGESSVNFGVIGHNMHHPLQNFSRSKLEAVTLQVEDLYLTMKQNKEVYVNDVQVQIPYSKNGTYGSVRVYVEDNYIISETTFGLRILVDGQNRLFLQVDERYKFELCGLCGTYSGHQGDDFITPGGQTATGVFEFGDSWRVPDNNECTPYPNAPGVCDYNEENEAYDECYTILGEAFKPCHESIHPNIYLNSCVYDYCATKGDRNTLCESLKSYAAACQVAGVKLPPWQAGTACADPPTTATPTTPTSSSPSPDQNFCPISCDFEKNLCGWEQLIQDSFDWTRHSGETPSNFTGPNQDHTTGAGFYIYTEASSITHGDSARLLSSMCHYNGPLCLHFWYHMYGSATAMALNIYLLKDNTATKLWSAMNNQGPEWHPGNVDIRVPGTFQIIVEGIRGNNARSDVAIDDISIHFGSCSGQFPGLISGTKLPSTTTEAEPICSLDCNFDSNLCSWNQMITDAFDWTWQSGSTPTLMTGPSADHTGGGHYLYIEASNVTHGDTARLISSECSDSGPQCLQFWYHMYGSADTMGLHVYLLQNRVANAVWRERNDQGNSWNLAHVDITTAGAFQIIFEGRRGSSEESDVAIDDVKLYHGQCADLSDTVTETAPQPDGNNIASPTEPTPAAPESPLVSVTALPPVVNATITPLLKATTDLINKDNDTEVPNKKPPPPHPVCQLHCNFEQDLCQWTQLLADVFDWTRHSGSTPTMMTGPSSDHSTGGGHYLYIEANSASLGDTARLLSSECSDSGPQCLQFWYHMYGSADTMGLHVYLYQDKKADAVWRKRNDQGNMWHLAQVDLTTTGTFQIIFEGRRGSNDQSDVAIDDVSLHRGQCADLGKPTIPAPITLSPVATEGPDLSPANSSPATQRPTATSSKPQETSTAIIITGTDTTATLVIDCDTQPPVTTNPLNTDVTAMKEQVPSRPTVSTRPQTTATPQPSTTLYPADETPEQPQVETTEGSITTAPSEQQDTSANENQTTATPQPLTTTNQEPTDGPQSPTIAKTESLRENQPNPEPRVRLQLTTTLKPHPPTDRPQSTTTDTTQSTISTTTPQPPATPEPTPSCPKNSHYTTCVPACSPTCTQLNGPPHCNDNNGCLPGCVCDDGFVQKWQVCVPIQQCGCVDANGIKRQFKEVWYTNHCNKKCECEKDDGVGKIDCADKDECDGNRVCLQNDKGNYNCQSTGFDECTVRGDPEYKTFDKMKHGFEGEQSYVLVRTNNLPSNLPEVYIEGINARTVDDNDNQHHDNSSSEEVHSVRENDDDDDDDDDDSEEHEERHRLQAIKIKVYNHTVEFKKHRRLIVDGKVTKSPVSPTAGLQIREHSSRIYLKTDFGLSVEFNGQSTAEIILPYLYRRKVGGLCGNFDGHKWNDQMKPDGTRAKSVQEFGESWRV